MRSLYPIGGVVFDGDRAPVTGAEVRDYHIDIKGVDEQGRRYHALNPDVFYWAHATFFVGTIHVAERFCGGLTEAQKRQLFDEHVEWYRMYGMSMRPVPASWEEFQDYWDHMCRNVLENNLRGTCRARSDRAAQTAVRPMGSGLAVGRAAQIAGAVLRLADRRSLRSAGARADGLPVVAPRRMAAPALRQPRAARLRLRAKRGTGSTRGPAPAGIVQPGESRPTHRWCRRRRATCRRWTSATTRMHYCPKVS